MSRAHAQTGAPMGTEPISTASSAAASRWALAFIFITMFVDTVGLGIVIPVTPTIISDLTGAGMSQAARYGGWLLFVFAGMLFLCSPLIGNLSDRFGRRPVLIASLVAIGIDYTITGLAPSLLWLFVGRTLSGMAGAAYITANAYIADVSSPETRAANFGLVGAAFGIGFVVGPALGGLLGHFGDRLPFFAAAGLAFANAAFGYFVLKESLPRAERRPLDWRRANPLGALVAIRKFPAVFGLVGVLILMRLAHDANPAIWSFYVYLKFHWTKLDVGFAMAFMGLAIALVYGVLTRIAIPRLGEARAAYLGLICGALGFAGYAFATQSWMMYGWMAVWAIMGLAMPSLNAIMSKQVPANAQGELQGALGSIGGLTSVVAPPLLTNIFGYFTSAAAPVYFPGAAFLAAGLMLALAALLLSRMHRSPLPQSPT